MLTGFYNSRVYKILRNSPIPLTSRDVWNIFELRYHRELVHFAGKTKRSSIDAVLSKFAKMHIVNRVVWNDTYHYFVNQKHCVLRYLGECDTLEGDEKIALSSLVSMRPKQRRRSVVDLA